MTSVGQQRHREKINFVFLEIKPVDILKLIRNTKHDCPKRLISVFIFLPCSFLIYVCSHHVTILIELLICNIHMLKYS